MPPLSLLQAVTGVLCPLLERRLGAEGAALGARLRGQLQALERDALEVGQGEQGLPGGKPGQGRSAR